MRPNSLFDHGTDYASANHLKKEVYDLRRTTISFGSLARRTITQDDYNSSLSPIKVKQKPNLKPVVSNRTSIHIICPSSTHQSSLASLNASLMNS